MNIDPHKHHYVISPNGFLQDEADMHVEAINQYNVYIVQIEKGTGIGLTNNNLKNFKQEVQFRNERLKQLAEIGIIGRSQEELAQSLLPPPLPTQPVKELDPKTTKSKPNKKTNKKKK